MPNSIPTTTEDDLMRSNESQRVCLSVVFGLIALLIPATASAQRRAIQWGVDFSRDASFMATCGDRVRVYEVKSGKLLRAIVAGRFTRTVAFSPVAKDLFAAGGDDGVLRIWRVGNKNFVRELRGHDGMIASVAFEKTGKYVASASVRFRKGKRDLGQFRLWEINTGKAVQSLDVMKCGIGGVSFSSDGKLVAFCRNHHNEASHVDVYRVQPLKLVTSIKLKADKKLETTQFGKAVSFGNVTCFEPDKKRLLVAGGICVRVDPGQYRYACRPTGLIWRAKLTKPSTAKSIVKPRRGYYRALGLTLDGKRFATGNGVRNTPDLPRLQMRDVATGKLLWNVASDVQPFGITMSPDGKLVAACQLGGVQLLNAITGASVRLIQAGK